MSLGVISHCDEVLGLVQTLGCRPTKNPTRVSKPVEAEFANNSGSSSRSWLKGVLYEKNPKSSVDPILALNFSTSAP